MLRVMYILQELNVRELDSLILSIQKDTHYKRISL